MFRKNIPSRLKIVIGALRVLVGIMLAQRRRLWPSITSELGQCIVLSGVSGVGMEKRHHHSHRHAAVRKHGTITQCCFNVGPASKTVDQLWNSIGWMPRVSDGLVLGQRRRRLIGIEPAMGCDAGPAIMRHLVGRPKSSVRGTSHRQVLNECWPAPAMVVEGIHVEDIF